MILLKVGLDKMRSAVLTIDVKDAIFLSLISIIKQESEYLVVVTVYFSI